MGHIADAVGLAVWVMQGVIRASAGARGERLYLRICLLQYVQDSWYMYFVITLEGLIHNEWKDSVTHIWITITKYTNKECVRILLDITLTNLVGGCWYKHVYVLN